MRLGVREIPEYVSIIANVSGNVKILRAGKATNGEPVAATVATLRVEVGRAEA